MMSFCTGIKSILAPPSVLLIHKIVLLINKLIYHCVIGGDKTVVSAGGLRINTIFEVLTKKRKYCKVQDDDICQIKIITHEEGRIISTLTICTPQPAHSCLYVLHEYSTMDLCLYICSEHFENNYICCDRLM